MSSIRQDADQIIQQSIASVLPDKAVSKALRNRMFSSGKLILVAVGKAAWQMANTAVKILGNRIDNGIVITKYNHVPCQIPGICCMEAGHPIPDQNSFDATRKALNMVQNLSQEDTVLFLLSGGGSALFEYPLISPEELTGITRQMLGCGADIVEINTIRKRMSAVKGGRFANTCAPAHVFSIVLSDILRDPLDMIASGPAYPDHSTKEEAIAIVEKYQIQLSEQARELLACELPQKLENVETVITGSVRQLCAAGAKACRTLGYKPVILTDQLNCEAREAGRFLSAIAKTKKEEGPLAIIAGGETVVHLTGNGKGGRNQELALAAAEGIMDLENVAIFSVGSDGTDGPTDVAGGYVDGYTCASLKKKGLNYHALLGNNDAYCALEAVDGLVVTGPTGTNVNDISVVLIR